MMNNCSQLIWELMDALRGLVYSKDISYSAVRLIFLKYAMDNLIGADTTDDMKHYTRLLNVFSSRDVDNGIDAVLPVMKLLDKRFQLDGILSYSVDDYARELFGIDRNNQRKNVNQSGFKPVMDLLSKFNLEDDERHTVGAMWADALVALIGSEKSAYTRNHTSSHALNTLAKEILQVGSDDYFCDFASGTGLSTIEITRDSRGPIMNVEINPNAAAISAMLYVMYGYRRFCVRCEDSLTKRIEEVGGNKIFVDGPLTAKIEKTEENKYLDSTLAVIDKTIHHYLEHDGTAVVTVPSGALFQTKSTALDLRNELIRLGMVRAVIALPPLWYGTNIGTNILVLRKGKPVSDVLFINAVKNGKSRGPAVGSNALMSVDIEKIIDVINHPREIEAFSAVVPAEVIEEREFNLIPANYVVAVVEEEQISLAEIDAQLADLYAQLCE